MTPLAPQKSDARVTQEIRNPMGWIVNRTYRLAQLTEIPEVQELIKKVVTHLDNYCAVEDVDPIELQGSVIPTRALRYITIQLGCRPCFACEGKGTKPGAGLMPCSTCNGTGVR